MIGNAFYFSYKLLWFLGYLNFCLDFFGHVGKRFDKKANVNFKIYDVIKWETNVLSLLIFACTYFFKFCSF